MYCPHSNAQEFTAEMNIHLSGLTNIDRPGILVCPRVSICLDCGVSRFITPEPELRALNNGVPSKVA
jgi:hypothetical protein